MNVSVTRPRALFTKGRRRRETDRTYESGVTWLGYSRRQGGALRERETKVRGFTQYYCTCQFILKGQKGLLERLEASCTSSPPGPSTHSCNAMIVVQRNEVEVKSSQILSKEHVENICGIGVTDDELIVIVCTFPSSRTTP